MPTKHPTILGALLLLCLGSLPLFARQGVSSPTLKPTAVRGLVITRPHTYLGSGAALSPDGRLLVYIGDDNGLYVRNVDDKSEHLLIKETDDGMGVFSDPAFAPDGQSVYVSASGGTSSYPSNIYVIGIDDGRSRKLTHSTASDGDGPKTQANDRPMTAPYKWYFSMPIPSPDGSGVVLVRARDAVQDKDVVMILDEHTGGMTPAGEGIPLAWNASASEFYSRTDKGVSILRASDRSLVGVLNTGDAAVVGVIDGAVVQLRNGSLVTSSVGRLGTPLDVSASRQVSSTGMPTAVGETLPLIRLQETPDSRRRLSIYDNGTVEQIEVTDVPRKLLK